MSKNKSIRLSLLANCYPDDIKYHLGFKLNGIVYCISHRRSSNKFCVLIPKSKLQKKFKSSKNEYLKITNNNVIFINKTNMFINKAFVIESIKNFNNEVK